MKDDLGTFIQALPKAELHLHLEGAVRPETLLALARRHGSTSLPDSIEGLREFYRFRDFDHFVEVYYAVCANLVDEEDFALIVRELGEELAAQNVRYAEVTFTPFNHTRRGVAPEALFTGVEKGRLQVEETHGVRIRWCTDIPGEFGADAGLETARLVLHHRPEGLVSFGLGGPEAGAPRGLFAEAFALARDAGLHSVPHAGETTGAATIVDALDLLGAERIGHGIRCLDDPELVQRLRREAVPLEVCPTSNLRLGLVATPADHPLPRLLAEGLTVTVNSDDPSMFNTTLNQEYQAAADMGLGPGDLADLARAGVRSSFLGELEKQALLDEIDLVPVPA